MCLWCQKVSPVDVLTVGAGVQGVVGIAGDGSRVYFVAKGGPCRDLTTQGRFVLGSGEGQTTCMCMTGRRG
jgi:hypothetical protein